MSDGFTTFAGALIQRGWQVVRCGQSLAFPRDEALRYPWLPDDVRKFLTSFEVVVSPSQAAWLITGAELAGKTDSSFAWNQWELDSLAAANGDDEWQTSIRAFWDDHFPVLLSVKSGYAYVAVRKDLTIIMGEEPEFEETDHLADTFSSFLEMLMQGDTRLDRLI